MNSIYKLGTVFLILALMMSCAKDENKPKFKQIKKLRVNDFKKKKLELKATLVLTNPNHLSYNIKRTIAEFTLNNKSVGTMVFKDAIKSAEEKDIEVLCFGVGH